MKTEIKKRGKLSLQKEEGLVRKERPGTRRVRQVKHGCNRPTNPEGEESDYRMRREQWYQSVLQRSGKIDERLKRRLEKRLEKRGNTP